MPPIETILAGLSDALTLLNLGIVVFGVVIGQIVGAIPGMGPVMAMAIAIPFTFTMDTLPAVAFLIGINKGGLFCAMLMADLCNLVVGQASLRLWSVIVRAPEEVIFPAALLACIVGVHLSTVGMFGVALMLSAAVLSLVMAATGFPFIVFIITFFPGARFEQTLSQSLVIPNGDPRALLDHPLALVLLAGAGIVAVAIRGGRGRRRFGGD